MLGTRSQHLFGAVQVASSGARSRAIPAVVVPNILMATRGVFIVVVSAVLARSGSTAIETQSPKVYALRLAASSLIIVAVWLVSRA